VKLYHGTSTIHRRVILRDGLQPLHGIAVFVTGDEQRAAGYGARAAAVEAFNRGHTHIKFVKPAVVFAIDVHEDLVEIDPSHHGDFAMPAGCGPDCIVSHYMFDPRPFCAPVICAGMAGWPRWRAASRRGGATRDSADLGRRLRPACRTL
jgi:hypothetical protein